jgi:hypothetical protein
MNSMERKIEQRIDSMEQKLTAIITATLANKVKTVCEEKPISKISKAFVNDLNY